MRCSGTFIQLRNTDVTQLTWTLGFLKEITRKVLLTRPDIEGLCVRSS